MTKEKTTEPPLCRRCGGKCLPSKALFNPLCGTPGFPDGILPGATLAPAADAVMIDCLKCEACGHSFALNAFQKTVYMDAVTGGVASS